MRWLLAASLLLWAPPAFAQVGPLLNHCIFEWDEAVALDNDLAAFNVYIATAPGGPYAVLGMLAAPSPGGGAHYVTQDMCQGQQNGQKYATVTAVDFAGNESARATAIPFAIDLTAPAGVTNLKVRP